MFLFIAVAVLPLLSVLVGASSYSGGALLRPRNDTDPDFPASPPSCGVCAQNYDSIKLCISVVPVVANFTTVIENPGSFVNVLTCGCSSTFNTTFPECVDCFQNTNQDSALNMSDPDAVLTGLEKVCAFEHSVGIGNNAIANSGPFSVLAIAAIVLILANAW
ncbi:hypothetical protein B0H19DRAFT_1153692 [Mycena capillaripes]|nr:hypothetical protein B0H19DRAFT_1153692 [Mycena capillaripes]